MKYLQKFDKLQVSKKKDIKIEMTVKLKVKLVNLVEFMVQNSF